MTQITFIHGIGNKPEHHKLLDIYQRKLAAEGGIDLGTEGISPTLVYWADVLYDAPDPDIASYESTLEAAQEEISGSTDVEFPLPANAEEAAFIALVSAKVGGTLTASEVLAPTLAIPEQRNLERVPLPWFVKRLFLKAFIRDVHHYLFDSEYSPRPGSTYRVRKEIRRRFVADLQSKAHLPGPHIVIAHSLGTVIAYDCLVNDRRCPKIDALITIGSPLGLDEVQDKLAPGWNRENGFPRPKLSGQWTNVFDRLDPVAGFDPSLANDFQEGGIPKIIDIHEPNDGLWRHSVVKYLRGAQLRKAIRESFGDDT